MRGAAIVRDRLLLPVPGGALAITKLKHSSEGARASVIINCAMSVKQSFYRPFAQFLATLGYSVVTWDYRGVGDSVIEEASARRVSLEQWGRDDLSLVIAAARTPGLPLVIVGHSFGGQIIALPDNRNDVCGALLIACPSGYVGHWRGKAKSTFMWSLAYVGLPLLSRLCGRFPASRLGLGSDLPRRVALQWGRWLRHPRYLARCPSRSAQIASFTAPVHAISFSDDEFAPSNAVEAMLSLYGGSSVTSELISPADHRLEKIGHMGFFHSRSSDGLWTCAANRIAAFAHAANPR